MSLFGSLQVASNTLQAMQIGLQVVGNNIANANTEGFIREKVNFTAAPVQELGNLTIGLGVRVDSITQVMDDFLGQQVRGATSDRISADLQNEAYKDLESLLRELGGNDLSTALTDFFGSIEDTLNPGAGDALSVRNLTVLEGKQLATEIQRLDERAKGLRDSYNNEIIDSAGQINQLATEIQRLNIQITQTEGGSAAKSEAGALRTQRNTALNKLSELIDLTVVEQPSGGLSLSVGGEFLVFEGQRREISVDTGTSEAISAGGEAAASLEFADTGKKLELTSGRIFGLTTARDTIVGDFRADLDGFAKSLINEFNKVYTSGQGLTGFTNLTSVDKVTNRSAPLNAAGLTFTPQTGSFDITVVNKNTGDTETTVIQVKLQGNDDDTSLNSLTAQIDAITGLSASIDSTGRLAISTDSPDTEFYFNGGNDGDKARQDTSGVLASLGLNTFFTGTGAESISVNRELDGIKNASKFAASSQGVGGGTGNAVALAGLFDKPIESLGGSSIIDQYSQLVNELAQNSTVAASVAEGLGVFEATLANELQAVSGVNIDEEAIDMISLQRIYQATARYISTIQEMLDTLIAL